MFVSKYQGSRNYALPPSNEELEAGGRLPRSQFARLAKDHPLAAEEYKDARLVNYWQGRAKRAAELGHTQLADKLLANIQAFSEGKRKPSDFDILTPSDKKELLPAYQQVYLDFLTTVKANPKQYADLYGKNGKISVAAVQRAFGGVNGLSKKAPWAQKIADIKARQQAALTASKAAAKQERAAISALNRNKKETAEMKRKANAQAIVNGEPIPFPKERKQKQGYITLAKAKGTSKVVISKATPVVNEEKQEVREEH